MVVLRVHEVRMTWGERAPSLIFAEGGAMGRYYRQGFLTTSRGREYCRLFTKKKQQLQRKWPGGTRTTSLGSRAASCAEGIKVYLPQKRTTPQPKKEAFKK